MRYRRLRIAGACYFFTVVTRHRSGILSSDKSICILREAFTHIRKKYPFEIDAIVILPDHLHCIWRLPQEDSDFSKRWRLIKSFFTRRMGRQAGSCWQKRYWEHLIRDERDWKNHMDYIHYNPVKHGYVKRVADWRYSSFQRVVEKGWYAADWGEVVPENILEMDLE